MARAESADVMEWKGFEQNTIAVGTDYRRIPCRIPQIAHYSRLRCLRSSPELSVPYTLCLSDQVYDL